MKWAIIRGNEIFNEDLNSQAEVYNRGQGKLRWFGKKISPRKYTSNDYCVV